jgi:hypothetical protein
MQLFSAPLLPLKDRNDSLGRRLVIGYRKDDLEEN